MHFKLIVVMVEDHHTSEILAAAREEGATGATVLNQARGEGLSPTKTFLGLSVGNQVDVILMLVEEHLSRHVLEKIAEVGKFDETSGTGIAFQVDVEDAIGVRHQISVTDRNRGGQNMKPLKPIVRVAESNEERRRHRRRHDDSQRGPAKHEISAKPGPSSWTSATTMTSSAS